MLIVTIWFWVDARHWFRGPKVNIEHKMLGRAGNVVEGVNFNEKQEESPDVSLDGKDKAA